MYDLLGDEVAPLVDETLRAGDSAVPFDATRLPPGIYLYKIRFGDRTITRRMTLMK